MLSLLLHVQDIDGTRMTDRQLRDEAMTLFIAGHETTALALSWTWYLLSQHPDVEAKLWAELEAVLLLATIAQRFQLTLVPGHPIALYPSITLRPAYGVRVTLERQR